MCASNASAASAGVWRPVAMSPKKLRSDLSLSIVAQPGVAGVAERPRDLSRPAAGYGFRAGPAVNAKDVDI